MPSIHCPFQPVCVCFYDLMQLADFVGFQMSLAPLLKTQLLYDSAATRMFFINLQLSSLQSGQLGRERHEKAT